MFHWGSGSGGSFNTTNNTVYNFYGPSSFKDGFGLALGNALGGITGGLIGGLLGGGISYMGGCNFMPSMSLGGWGGWGNFGGMFSGGFAMPWSFGTSGSKSSDDADSTSEDKKLEKAKNKKIKIDGKDVKIKDLTDEQIKSMSADDIKRLSAEKKNAIRSRYEDEELDKSKLTDEQKKALGIKDDESNDNKDSCNCRCSRNGGSANDTSSVQAAVDSDGTTASAGSGSGGAVSGGGGEQNAVDFDNLPTEWTGANINKYLEAIKNLTLSNDKNTLLQLAKNTSIPTGLRQAAKQKFYNVGDNGETNNDAKTNAVESDLSSLDNKVIGVVDTSPMRDWTGGNKKTINYSNGIITLETNGGTTIKYKKMGIVDGEILFQSDKDNQIYALQKSGDNFYLMQYEYHKGYNKADLTKSVRNKSNFLEWNDNNFKDNYIAEIGRAHV